MPFLGTIALFSKLFSKCVIHWRLPIGYHVDIAAKIFNLHPKFEKYLSNNDSAYIHHDKTSSINAFCECISKYDIKIIWSHKIHAPMFINSLNCFHFFLTNCKQKNSWVVRFFIGYCSKLFCCCCFFFCILMFQSFDILFICTLKLECLNDAKFLILNFTIKWNDFMHQKQQQQKLQVYL